MARAVGSIGLVAALVCAAASLHAEPPSPPAEPPPDAAKALADECLEAFDSAQRLRAAAELLEARRRLLSCGRASCPDAVRVKCVEWLEELRDNVPSIVVAARDAAGSDVIDARVFVDGELVAERIDGTAIELDPGPHELRVERGEVTSVQSILVRQGEKNRMVRVALAREAPKNEAPKKKAPKKPAAPVERGFDMPVLSWIGFSTAAAALAVGTVTGIVALVKGDALETSCEGGICNPPDKSDLDAGLAVAHVSTISFAVAGAGAILGVVGLLVAGDDDEERRGESKPKVGLRLGTAGVEARW